jgi:DNA-directed RNA polymerase subunit RPC12/RpoP
MCKHDGRVMNEDDDGYVCQYCGAEIEDLRHNPEAKWKRPQFTQRLAEAIGVP